MPKGLEKYPVVDTPFEGTDTRAQKVSVTSQTVVDYQTKMFCLREKYQKRVGVVKYNGIYGF